MIGCDIPARTGQDLVRLARALGTHRYVAGRLHVIHAFAVDAAAAGGPSPALEEGAAWARAVLSDATIEHDSRDERLLRRASNAELEGVLEAFLVPGPGRDAARRRLAELLVQNGLTADDGPLFDELHEADIHPLLIDAGWELLPLAALDPERHRGAIDAFGERHFFLAARLKEESAAAPVTPLQELPAFGAAELLRAIDDAGTLVAPAVLWTQGDDTYHSYVLRGVLRAAKLAG